MDTNLEKLARDMPAMAVFGTDTFYMVEPGEIEAQVRNRVREMEGGKLVAVMELAEADAVLASDLLPDVIVHDGHSHDGRTNVKERREYLLKAIAEYDLRIGALRRALVSDVKPAVPEAKPAE